MAGFGDLVGALIQNGLSSSGTARIGNALGGQGGGGIGDLLSGVLGGARDAFGDTTRAVQNRNPAALGGLGALAGDSAWRWLRIHEGRSRRRGHGPAGWLGPTGAPGTVHGDAWGGRWDSARVAVAGE